MEEILKQLLEGQKQLFEGQNQLFKTMDQLAEGQKQLFKTVDQLAEGQKQILNRLDNLEGQVRENTDFIKSLLHATLTKDAISHLATKEDVASLDVKIEALNVRLFHQEAELCRLKVVK